MNFLANRSSARIEGLETEATPPAPPSRRVSDGTDGFESYLPQQILSTLEKEQLTESTEAIERSDVGKNDFLGYLEETIQREKDISNNRDNSGHRKSKPSKDKSKKEEQTKERKKHQTSQDSWNLSSRSLRRSRRRIAPCDQHHPTKQKERSHRSLHRDTSQSSRRRRNRSRRRSMESRSSRTSSKRSQQRRRSRSSSHTRRRSKHNRKSRHQASSNSLRNNNDEFRRSGVHQQRKKRSHRQDDNSSKLRQNLDNGKEATVDDTAKNAKVGIGVIFDPFGWTSSEKAPQPPPPTWTFQQSSTIPFQNQGTESTTIPGAMAVPGINQTSFSLSFDDIEAPSTPQHQGNIGPPPLSSSHCSNTLQGSLDPSELVTAMLVTRSQPSSNVIDGVTCLNADVEQGSSSTIPTAELFLENDIRDGNDSCLLSEHDQQQQLNLSDIWANTKLRNIIFIIGGLALGAVIMQGVELLVMSKR